MDDGDYVVVINAERLVVTGNKEKAKEYYNYSGFPSGLKTTKLADVRKTDASKAVVAAVKGMLPKNKLAADRLARLRVFNGEEHGHMAQKPVKVEVK
jgi:large subunit ribosomal protein L13